ncbi:MAG: hypothetical protein AB8U66_00220 [Rickettsiales endosymbiont of Dermacentor nuttalli]
MYSIYVFCIKNYETALELVESQKRMCHKFFNVKSEDAQDILNEMVPVLSEQNM